MWFGYFLLRINYTKAHGLKKQSYLLTILGIDRGLVGQCF